MFGSNFWSLLKNYFQLFHAYLSHNFWIISVSYPNFSGLQIFYSMTRCISKWITITTVAIETAVIIINQAQTINIVNQKQNNRIIRYGFFKQKLLIKWYIIIDTDARILSRLYGIHSIYWFTLTIGTSLLVLYL